MTVNELRPAGGSDESSQLPKVIRHPEVQRWLGSAITHASSISNSAWIVVAKQKELTLQIAGRAWCVADARGITQLVRLSELRDPSLIAAAVPLIDDDDYAQLRIALSSLGDDAALMRPAALAAVEALIARSPVRARLSSHSAAAVRYLRSVLSTWLPQPAGILEADERSIPTSDVVSAETFNVLARLTGGMTRANYVALLPEFRAHVRQPFEKLTASALGKLPLNLFERLETSHGVFAPLLSDDGRTLQSPAPLACFCLVGRNRRRDAFLFIHLDRDGVVFGLHAGALNDERRATYLRRLREEFVGSPHVLPALLRRFVIGDSFGNVDDLLEELLSGDADAFLSISQRLPSHIVLRTAPDEIASQIASAFVVLFTYLQFAAIDDYAHESEDLLPARIQIRNSPVFDPRPENRQPYSIDDACRDLLHERTEVEAILRRLSEKKNVILEGPPGVGKTYLASRIARAHVAHTGSSNVVKVQFHQSYGYEDFVQGYRPSDRGTFELKSGAFHDLCQLAAARHLENFVLIIDEFNRGNMTRILGELLSLIEHDKRSDDYAVRLTYGAAVERFYVPPNLYIMALMNTADRSIALIDHALRRRFSVFTLQPRFNATFRQLLQKAGATEAFADAVSRAASAMNDAIRNHASLGPGFEVGHSYFLPHDQYTVCDERWLGTILEREIRPLLREYWIDTPEEIEALLRSFPVAR